MESPFRGEGDPDQTRFEGKSYLRERLAQRLDCEEEEVQEKVSKRLELKQERAQKKREFQLQRRRKSIAERLRKIREARRAVDTKFELKRGEIMERQEERQTSATRRRRTSLENIKKARALHNRRVNQKRRESFDQGCGFSPARTKGLDEIAFKLAKAERNREFLRRERRRRSVERYEEGKARALQQGCLGDGGGIMGGEVGGGDPVSLRVAGGQQQQLHQRGRRRMSDARQEAKARQAQRMRSLRRRMRSRSSRAEERKARVYASCLIQEWWRCVSTGRSFHIGDLNIGTTSPEDEVQEVPEGSASSPHIGSGLASQEWSTQQGLSLNVGMECGVEQCRAGGRGRGSVESMSASPYDRCEREVEGEARVGVKPVSFELHPGSEPSHRAALAIQSFLRRNLHPLKVVNALMAARPSVNALCDALRAMSTATFDEAIEIMSSRATVSRCEAALKALRMGREMRCVPHTVRTARAFLSSFLVNFYPTSSLDDEGALSSSPEGTAPLQLEKDRLIRASGNAVHALLQLEAAVNSSFSAGGGGSCTLGPSQFRRLRRASGVMVRARVVFCRCFAEWKHKDAQRLSDELTAASVDILLMQLRAERDLRVAAVRYSFKDSDDDGALFSTGYDQIKEGTQRQLAKMMNALEKLVGRDQAMRRMNEATDCAIERLHADEVEEEDNFLQEQGMLGGDREEGILTAGGGIIDGASLLPEASAGGSVGVVSAVGSTGAKQAPSPTAAVTGNQDDIAGPSRPLSAGDLLGNEWLVHEVMISDDVLTVTMEEAEDNDLLRSGNPSNSRNGGNGTNVDEPDFWKGVEAQVAAGDHTPLLGLISELRDRIVGLTPRRRDLAAETHEAMDVELLAQMMQHGAFDVGSFFRMVAFAGERILELEAPIRNDATRDTLVGWGKMQREVEGGRRQLEPAMVQECFQFLFSKTDEIHVDILNAHLHFVTPFLKQHGVEYERDRFTEKLDAGETSLDMTHLWLHRAVTQLRASAATSFGTSPAPATQVSQQATTPTSAMVAEAEFARQLLSDLEQRRGEAYLKLLRVAIVDNLLGAIMRVERSKTSPGAVGWAGAVVTGCGSFGGGTASTGVRGSTTGSPVAVSASVAGARGTGHGEGGGGGEGEDTLDGVAVPETLLLDQYRIVVTAAGAEQVAYTAALIAFARQALAGVGVGLPLAEEVKLRSSLMVLFETEDVTSADICAQVVEMTRVVSLSAGKVFSAAQLSTVSARSRNVLTTGNCPVYRLYVRRELSLVREMLLDGGMPEERFTESLRKAGLLEYKTFLLERVARPLMVIEWHNEAVFSTFYNEIIPLALQTTNPATAEAHANAMNVD